MLPIWWKGHKFWGRDMLLLLLFLVFLICWICVCCCGLVGYFYFLLWFVVKPFNLIKIDIFGIKQIFHLSLTAQTLPPDKGKHWKAHIYTDHTHALNSQHITHTSTHVHLLSATQRKAHTIFTFLSKYVLKCLLWAADIVDSK